VVGRRVRNEWSWDRFTTPYEQPSSQAIEDNRSTSFPSASGQCLSAVERVPELPGVFRGPVGWPVFGSRHKWLVEESAMNGVGTASPHPTNSQTAKRLRTIVQHFFHQRLVSVHQRFCGFLSG
jgi:hypothetical protein